MPRRTLRWSGDSCGAGRGTLFPSGRGEPASPGPLVHEDLLDDEQIDVELRFLLLGVGDGGAQGLLDVPRRDLWRVPEDGESVVDLFAAHEVRHEAGLLGRALAVAQRCLS